MYCISINIRYELEEGVTAMVWWLLIPTMLVIGIAVRGRSRRAEVGLLDQTAYWRRVRCAFGGKRIAR
jgi:hypothetical protein